MSKQKSVLLWLFKAYKLKAESKIYFNAENMRFQFPHVAYTHTTVWWFECDVPHIFGWLNAWSPFGGTV